MKLLAALLPPALLSACLVPFGEREEILAGITPDQVLKAAREVVEKEGFTIDAEQTRPERIHTEWQNELALEYRKGTRRRVEISANPVDGGTKFTVKVVKEINDTMTFSLDPEKARWISGGRDDAVEHQIALSTRMKLDLLAIKWQD